MREYFLLWTIGPDRPGIVAEVSKILFENGCNLEDSSMMRLGSEFGILLIFTSTKKISPRAFSKLETKYSLSIGLKKISKQLASFKPYKDSTLLVTVYGFDKPGLVYHVTKCLAQQKFNISDLSTHRTTGGGKPGYMLFIEGEPKNGKENKTMERALDTLAKKLDVRISIKPINAAPL